MLNLCHLFHQSLTVPNDNTDLTLIIPVMTGLLNSFNSVVSNFFVVLLLISFTVVFFCEGGKKCGGLIVTNALI